ncbi:hypothetical protein QZH41_018320, partial [Actinostola sp. cb2023]
MTAFGGDFFVAPNPINFHHVFAEFTRMGESGNYVVLVTVALMWTAFIIGLVFARRADLQDVKKIINCAINLLDETKHNKKTYKISIQTGLWLGSGTTASVGLIIHGIDQSIPIYFKNNDHNKQLFARGSVNTYWVTVSEDIGEVFKLRIWHNNAGNNPSWFVNDIVINDESESSQWVFLVNRWLAVDKGGITTDVMLTEEYESKNLKNRFFSRALKQFTNSHLWLSIFTKSVHSPFTRCQRLSCCFLVLTSTMVTNAMFYRLVSGTSGTFRIGPFEMNLRSVNIGIQSALITLPINVVVAFIFEKVKSKKTAVDGGMVLEEENVQGFIPRACIPVAWILCICGAMASSLFTFFYSLMWGADIANQWLLSIMISFTQDVLVNQPIKIVILVSLLAMIIKKPIDNRQEVTVSVKRDSLACHAIEIPLEDNLAKARDIKAAKSTSKRFLLEITFYVVFAVLVFIVCYGNVDNERFRQTNSLKTMGDGFYKVRILIMDIGIDFVKDTDSFWQWFETEAIPFLYGVTWYNGQPFRGPEGYISNREGFLIGMPRLRQLRVKS